MRDCPCINCDNRNITCHCTCKDYKEFARACEEIRQARYAAHQSEYRSEYASRLVKRNRKR